MPDEPQGGGEDGPEPIELTMPTMALGARFLEMADELRRNREPVAQGVLEGALEEHLRTLYEQHLGVGLGAGMVPSTSYWLVRGGREILGELNLRHHLNASLEREGGHIGYRIRPSERGKGLGVLQLRLGLRQARRRGMEQAILTCNEENVPSARTIERCGGVRIGSSVSSRTGKRVRIYRVPCPEGMEDQPQGDTD